MIWNKKKTTNTIIELNMAARASIIDTASTLKNRIKKLMPVNKCLLLVLIKYRRNGILNAMEAAVMFLFPAKPFNLRTSYCVVP